MLSYLARRRTPLPPSLPPPLTWVDSKRKLRPRRQVLINFAVELSEGRQAGGAHPDDEMLVGHTLGRGREGGWEGGREGRREFGRPEGGREGGKFIFIRFLKILATAGHHSPSLLPSIPPYLHPQIREKRIPLEQVEILGGLRVINTPRFRHSRSSSSGREVEGRDSCSWVGS